MTLEAMHLSEQQPQSEAEKVLERRQELQRMLGWVSLVQAKAGEMYAELIAEMVKNNDERRAHGIHVDACDHYRNAPQTDETDMVAVQAFLESPRGATPIEPQMRIRPDAA